MSTFFLDVNMIARRIESALLPLAIAATLSVAPSMLRAQEGPVSRDPTPAAPRKPDPEAHPSPEPSLACVKKVERSIRRSAKAMGLDESNYGFGLRTVEGEQAEPGDHDVRNLTTGMFQVPDGYLSESGASARVRLTKRSCEILEQSISIGR